MHRNDEDDPVSGGDLLEGDSGHPVAWIPVASGQARLTLAGTGRVGEAPLRLDFDFMGGGGFVVARRELDARLPEDWELRVRVRGDALPNVLEIKLVDAAGSSVWRWKSPPFASSPLWSALRIPGHAFEFAWGPAGGRRPERIGAIEVAVVAPPGGKGDVEFADLHIVDRGVFGFAEVEASSSAEPTNPTMAIDGSALTSWQSEAGEGPHTLTLVFDEARDVGGLVITWRNDALPRAYRVEIRGHGGEWSSRYDVGQAGAGVSFAPLAEFAAAALRIVALATDPTAGVGIAGVELRPYGWASSPSEFLTNVARASRRGAFPRYLSREQSLWTPVATPSSGPIALLSEDGAVEIGEGGFMLEPSLFDHDADAHADTDGGWITWADVERTQLLESPPLPIATVRWRRGDLGLEVTPFAEGTDADPRVVVRYRVRNHSLRSVHVTLFVSARPFQVTPPWQAFRGLGGPSPIASIEQDGGIVRVGPSAALACSPSAAAFAATTLDSGGLGPFLSRGELPHRSAATDPHARAEAALAFELAIRASAVADVFVACRPDAGADRDALPDQLANAARSGEAGLGHALNAWRSALPARPPTGSEAFAAFTTATAHILACRDGAALQPGPRRYTRSWIRDGAIMSAALSRAGRSDAAREFAEWYAPFQRSDGYVPCCVDRDGVDSLVENDSHGQLVYTVAETFRFTRDIAFVRAMWPRCALAAEWIESLRATRKTAEFEAGPGRVCFGLLPESVSHEGYLAQPVHSYWDDFWALRGLRDAASLADALGLGADAARWRAAALDLASAIAASMRMVMKERNLATVPASVEWADFDPTAIAGAISLVGAANLFPADALARTFDEYLKGVRARRDGTAEWNNYSPYEVRIVGALVRLGRRDDANELLRFLLGDRRPGAWNQWPEIVWRDAAAPAHLGDLPHCWIGGEFMFALRSMLLFEREDDGALVVGAGITSEWLDGDEGIDAKGMPTWYGPVDVRIRRDGETGYFVTVAGAEAAPGGVVVALPEPWTLVDRPR